MTTPYPDGYMSAINALSDPKSSPEARRAARSVLDQINADRIARPAHLADLRNPQSEYPTGNAMFWMMLSVAVATIVLTMVVHSYTGVR